MTHLTDVELVDLLDGTLASSRERHLEVCDSCRATAARLREALARAADVKMPEPSPLFWEHFSARVHEGVRAAETGQPPRGFGWAHGTTVNWALSGALLTLVLVGGVWRASAPRPQHSASPTAPASMATVADQDAFDPETLGHDEAWALVRTVADDVPWDDAAAEGFGVRPGSVEHAMVALTGDERSELVRLLQAETKQPGA